jgi:leucyl aminopeptidase (aminopeptidase T)
MERSVLISRGKRSSFKCLLLKRESGGTVRLALGRANSECSSVNDFALHWDIVEDLPEEGGIHLDGANVFENGRSLF